MGSTTTQDRPGARAIAPGHAAFRFDDSVGIPFAIFRSSIPSPSIPLFTLQWAPRDAHCKTRGRVARYSFLVRLSQPLLHAGLSRRTVNYFFSLTTIISPYQRQLLLLLDCKDQSPKLWECGNPAVFAGFPRAVERVENLGLVFHAFHGPAFPQLSLFTVFGFCGDRRLIRPRPGFPPVDSSWRAPRGSSGCSVR